MGKGYHLLFYTILVLTFMTGWVGHSVYLDITGDPQPLIPGKTPFLARLDSMITFQSAEIMSPRDRITEDKITVYDDHVSFKVEEPHWSAFTNTNSMDPVLDIGANGIEIKPKNANDIHIGDIISYQSGNGIIVHRVIDIGVDSFGIYYTVKGDNNAFEDTAKIRFEQVQGIVVAVIY